MGDFKYDKKKKIIFKISMKIILLKNLAPMNLALIKKKKKYIVIKDIKKNKKKHAYIRLDYLFFT